MRPIASLDTSEVTDMSVLFAEFETCNPYVNSWQTGKSTNMFKMFRRAGKFNLPLNCHTLQVDLALEASEMIHEAHVFNQPLNSWQISSDALTQGTCS